MTKSVGLFALVAAAFTLTATLALAAQPQKRAVYFGGTGGEESTAIRFEVSANGSMLTKFGGPFEAACGNPAPAPRITKSKRRSPAAASRSGRSCQPALRTASLSAGASVPTGA